MCIAGDGSGLGMFTMEENDGTGDGEWGKLMWVMGTSWVDTAMEGCTRWVTAGREGSTG